MTAQRIGVYTIDFPDPTTIGYENNKFNTLNDSVSFQYRISGNIQTLSTKGVDAGNDPYGILYVPDVQSEACRNEEQQYVGNATRLANLPTGQHYALIAVAPWFSRPCMLEYFTAARRAPTKSIFVFLPDQGNAKPPVLNDASWNLQDGGRWQSDNSFPTYALSSTTGGIIMTQMGLYSGNLTDVPNGEELATIFDRRDYVRLWAQIATDSDTRLPSLWVFLVIVLAILIVAVTGTSIAMHIIQRRRRRDLHRRVLEGEVDLEALGVKRLNVSQETLDKLPIYTYTGGSNNNNTEKPNLQLPPPALTAASPAAVPETGATAHPLVRHSSVPTSVSVPSTAWSQATCPICLDDFEPNETKVRELPCRHIFHPDCIDQFLLRNSSLCPMCKQSVLPPGACPVNITNMMVRRERQITRMRARGAPGTAQSDANHSSATTQPADSHIPFAGPLASLRGRIGGAMAGRRIFSAPERTQHRPADIEMASNNTAPAPSSATPNTAERGAPNTHDCTPTQNRREWARQRALQLLGNRHAPASDVPDENAGPRWRRTLDKVFPGFR